MSQFFRSSLAAAEQITSPLLNLTIRSFLNPASLRYSRTCLGGGENHSAGGVLVHLGSLSASMSRLCLAFRGSGDTTRRRNRAYSWSLFQGGTRSRLSRHISNSADCIARPGSR